MTNKPCFSVSFELLHYVLVSHRDLARTRKAGKEMLWGVERYIVCCIHAIQYVLDKHTELC